MENSMVDQYAKIIWNYMLMHHTVEKSDVIMVLGSRDTRTASYAAELYHQGLAPVIVFSGSGTVNNHKRGREKFIGSTEAEIFTDIALQHGVPKESIIIENQSQNTGENYQFTIKKLEENNIHPKRVILVQKPYMERRTYATGKVWLPNIELLVTSPRIAFENYADEISSKEETINAMVGDLQRIKEYPKRGFSIEQDIPEIVWQAYEYLVSQGYTSRLL